MGVVEEVVIKDGTGVTVERYWVDRDTGARLEGGEFDCSGLVADAWDEVARGWGRGVTRDRSALEGFFRAPGLDYGEPPLVEPEDDEFWTCESPVPDEVVVTRAGEWDDAVVAMIGDE